MNKKLHFCFVKDKRKCNISVKAESLKNIKIIII